MKKFLSLICTIALLLTACAAPSAPKESVANILTDENKVEGEITVSCYDTMVYQRFLETAGKAFEEKYPGTKVNVESFGAMPEIKTKEEGGKSLAMVTMQEDPQAKSDYINKINTELMSGKGADILALDVLPFYKYAENGQLENLKEYMENDSQFNKNDYRTNIFDAVTNDKGQFILPVDYAFTSFAYDSTLFTQNQLDTLASADKFSFEQIIEFGKEAFEDKNASSEDPIYMFGLNDGSGRGGLLYEMFKQNYTSFIDISNKKANFTDGQFVNLLNSIKEYAQYGYIKQGSEVMKANGEFKGANGNGEPMMSPEMFSKDTSVRYFFKPQNSMALMQMFNKNTNLRMMTTAIYGGGNTEDDMLTGIMSNNNGEIPFTYNQAYSINSNSANKRTAWEFIKFLLSDEMQLSLTLSGLPVNKAAFLEKTKQNITGELYANGMDSMFGAPKLNGGGASKGDMEMPEIEYTTELDENGQKVFDEYVAQVEKYTNQINAFFIHDTTIEDIVLEEIKFYFDGSKTSDEVANVLQSKISLYLNE